MSYSSSANSLANAVELFEHGESPLPSRNSTISSGDQLRRNARERAEVAALRVPWPRVQEAAIRYARWQVFALRVRTACEPAEEVPSDLALELSATCPGFLEWTGGRRRTPGTYSVWRDLVEWIANSYFNEARAEGWYEAAVHYGFNRLESLRAWAEWTHANVRAALPSLPGSPKLGSSVDALLESRALLLWTTLMTTPDGNPGQAVRDEIGARVPEALSHIAPWNRSAYIRLAGLLDKPCTIEARAEGWFGTLRHQLLHHPRYHRLIHFCTHCQAEWQSLTPRPSPTFDHWKRACDEYYVPHPVR